MIKKIPLSLPYQVLYAAILGILLGLLIGDKTIIFEPIGRIYTMMMEVVVFPYLICTLLTSLGGLSPTLSLRLFKKSWVIYLFLILVIYLTLYFLGNALPFNITTGIAQANIERDNILKFLIPENLIYDLNNNYVPAVIIFCIFFGLVLQHVRKKKRLFNMLKTITQACLLFWKWLITLAPVATFALLAYISGTIRINQLYDMSEFLILFFLGSLLLIFWIIPVIISSVTNLKVKDIIFELRDALIISAVTTLSVVSLPYIEKVTEKFVSSQPVLSEQSETANIIKTILLISYPFAQLGNFFVCLFILFASLYFDHPLNNVQYHFLPFISFLSSIGSPSSSINSVEFLTNWLNLPKDNVSLYVSLLPVIRYAQVILSVMGFAFLSILIAFSFFSRLKINYKKLFFHLVSYYLLLIILTGLFKNIFPNPGEKNYNRLNSFSIDYALTKNVKAVRLPPFDEANVKSAISPEDSLFRIQRTGVLRVGFNADMRPFVFYNNKHELVGYDIAYAYALAAALNATIQFIPFTWQHLITDLEADQFDIAMSAIYVTEQRLAHITYTHPYFHSPISMIVPKVMQNEYQSARQIQKIKNLKIGVFNDPVLIPLIQQNFPNASIVILETVSNDVPLIAFQQGKIDAVLWSQAQTQDWVLAHPQYVSVIPDGIAAPFLMAYMVQQGSPQFLNFLNYWLTIKKNEGFENQMVHQWILIRPHEDQHPRWSLLFG